MAKLVNDGNINWDGNWQTIGLDSIPHASTNLLVDSGSTKYSAYWAGNASNTDIGALVFMATETNAGTITVTLQSANDTAFTDTLVDEQTSTFTIDSTTKALNYFFFKLSSSEAESASKYYRYKFTSNNAADTTFRADVTDTAVISIKQVLAATATLSAGDITFVVGNANGATGNPAAATVTVNVNSTTQWGACYITGGGVLSYRTNAATTTQLDFAGNITLYSSGSFYMGSTSTKIPNNSRAILRFVCGSTDQYGLTKYYGSTMQLQGTANTYYKTTLAADIASGTIKSFTVTDTTGWQVGDRLWLCYSKGNLANSADEVVTITGISGTTIYIDTNGDGSGTGVSVGNHHGHEDPQGIVANLTQPVIVCSASGTYRSYLNLESNASHTDLDLDGVRFYRMAVGSTAEWTTYGFSMDDVSYELCSSIGANNYHSWKTHYQFTRIVWCGAGGGGAFMSTWYSNYYSPSVWVLDGFVLGWITVGSNWTYYGTSPLHIYYKNGAIISLYASGGEFSFMNNCASKVYFENVEYSNNNGLTARAAFNLNTIASFSSKNTNYGRFGGAYGTIFNSWNSALYLGVGDTINASFTEVTWGSMGIERTPRIRISNYGGVSGRHKSISAYGTISDQITNGQTAAYAKGGSGICVAINPTSTTAGQTIDWEFYIPVTAATQFTLKFYITKTTSGFDGSVKVSIFDSDDDLTKLLDSETISNASIPLNDGSGDDWTYQYSATPVTPTNTGFCRVVVSVLNGASTGDILIDDVSVV